ncbi:hypothetical protein CBS101457_004788 [Exobasidium rhododendri]|nr:hypothetical protein CBS101457_004788 [Exobasidium rhododendri]
MPGSYPSRLTSLKQKKRPVKSFFTLRKKKSSTSVDIFGSSTSNLRRQARRNGNGSGRSGLAAIFDPPSTTIASLAPRRIESGVAVLGQTKAQIIKRKLSKNVKGHEQSTCHLSDTMQMPDSFANDQVCQEVSHSDVQQRGRPCEESHSQPVSQSASSSSSNVATAATASVKAYTPLSRVTGLPQEESPGLAATNRLTFVSRPPAQDTGDWPASPIYGIWSPNASRPTSLPPPPRSPSASFIKRKVSSNRNFSQSSVVVNLDSPSQPRTDKDRSLGTLFEKIESSAPLPIQKIAGQTVEAVTIPLINKSEREDVLKSHRSRSSIVDYTSSERKPPRFDREKMNIESQQPFSSSSSSSDRRGIDNSMLYADEASVKKTVRRSEGKRAGSEASASLRTMLARPSEGRHSETISRPISTGRVANPPRPSSSFSNGVRNIFRSRSKSTTVSEKRSRANATIPEVDEFGRTESVAATTTVPTRERKSSFFFNRSKIPTRPKVNLDGVDFQDMSYRSQWAPIALVQSHGSAERKSEDTGVSHSTPPTTPPAREAIMSGSRSRSATIGSQRANVDKSLTMQALESVTPQGLKRGKGVKSTVTPSRDTGPSRRDQEGFPRRESDASLEAGMGLALTTASPSVHLTPSALPRASVPKIWQVSRTSQLPLDRDEAKMMTGPESASIGRPPASSTVSGSMSSFQTAKTSSGVNTSTVNTKVNDASQRMDKYTSSTQHTTAKRPLSDLIMNLEQRISSSKSKSDPRDSSGEISSHDYAIAAGPDTSSYTAIIPPATSYTTANLAMQKRHTLELDSLLDMLERSRKEAVFLKVRNEDLKAELYQEVTRVLELQRNLNRKQEKEALLVSRIGILEEELKNENADRIRIAELLERVQQAVDNAAKVDAEGERGGVEGEDGEKGDHQHHHVREESSESSASSVSLLQEDLHPVSRRLFDTTLLDDEHSPEYGSSANASVTKNHDHTIRAVERSPSLHSYTSTMDLSVNDKELSWSLEKEEPLEETLTAASASSNEADDLDHRKSTTPTRRNPPPDMSTKRFSFPTSSSRLPLPTTSVTPRSPRPTTGNTPASISTSRSVNYGSAVLPASTSSMSSLDASSRRLPSSSPIAQRTVLPDRFAGSLIARRGDKTHQRPVGGSLGASSIIMPSSSSSSGIPQSVRYVSNSSSSVGVGGGGSRPSRSSLTTSSPPSWRKVSGTNRFTSTATTGGDTSYTARTPDLAADLTVLDDSFP